MTSFRASPNFPAGRGDPLHIAALRAVKNAGSAFKAATALILVTALTACGGGGSDGPATVVNQVSSNTATANAYTGPAAATADQTRLSFQD